MIYRGYFKNYQGDDYRVEINTSKTDGKSTLKEITLGGTPFVVSFEGGGSEDVFMPVKCSTATIQIEIDGQPMYDLYTAVPNNNGVELRKKNQVGTYDLVWKGYVQPSIYNQSYNEERTMLSVDCLDALGTSDLYYIEKSTFGTTGDVLANQILVYDLLKEFCEKVGIGYIVQNVQFYNEGASKDVYISNTYVHQMLYVSEDSYVKDDVSGNPMFDFSENDTYKEIFEKINLFFHTTMFQWGDTLYMLSLSNTNVPCYRWNLSDDTMSTYYLSIDKSYPVIYQDATLNLASTYNKLTITAPRKDVDDLVPVCFDDAYLTNNNGAWNMYEGWKCAYSPFEVVFGQKNFQRYPISDMTTPLYKVDDGYFHFYYIQFLTHKYYTTYQYPKGSTTKIEGGKFLTLDDFYGDNEKWGSTFIKFNDKQLKDLDLDNQKYKSNSASDWVNAIMFKYDESLIGSQPPHRIPIFTTANKYLPSLITDSTEQYLSLNMSVQFQWHKDYCWCSTDPQEGGDMKAKTMWMDALIKWGNKYFTNYTTAQSDNYWERKGRWVDEVAFCRIPLDVDGKTLIYETDFSVVDTSGDYVDEVQELDSGYIIKAPFDMSTIQSDYQQPQITLYAHSYGTFATWEMMQPRFCFIKDFSVKFCDGYSTSYKSSEYESDTTITNVCEDKYLSYMNDIEYANNSDFDKGVSYSYLWQKSARTDNMRSIKQVRRYIDKSHFQQDPATGTDMLRYSEQYAIEDLIEQYKTPKKVMECKVQDNDIKPHTIAKLPTNFGNSTKFILDSFEMDYRTGYADVTLVEKSSQYE